MKFLSKRCVVPAILLAILFSPVVCSAVQTRKPVSGIKTKPIYTADLAKSYLAEVAPLVEQAAGRKLKKIPSIKLVTPEEIVPTLKLELIPQLRALLPGLSEDDIASYASGTAEAYSLAVLGKYGTSKQIIYLIPANLPKRLKASDISQTDQQQVVELVIAHELTHALQDQYVGLARLLRTSGSIEKSLATNATMEGQAMFVQDQVAEALKFGDAQRKFARALVADPAAGKDPLSDIYTNMSSKVMRDIYMGGRDFIAWQYKAGGNERVWNILAHPPANTSMIFHPDTYTQDSTSTTDYAAVLKGMEKRFGNRNWTVQNNAVGEIQFRAVYAPMDDKVRDKVITNIEQAQSLMASDGANGAASIAVMVLKDSSIAPDMFSAIEQMTKANIEKINKGSSVKISPPVFTDFSMDNVSAGRRFSFTVKQGKLSYPNEFVHVCRGRVALEIFTQKVDLPQKRAADIAEEIFKRLPQNLTSPQQPRLQRPL